MGESLCLIIGQIYGLWFGGRNKGLCVTEGMLSHCVEPDDELYANVCSSWSSVLLKAVNDGLYPPVNCGGRDAIHITTT